MSLTWDGDLLDRQIARLRNNPEVQRAMSFRCKEEGHNYENCVTGQAHTGRGLNSCVS